MRVGEEKQILFNYNENSLGTVGLLRESWGPLPLGYLDHTLRATVLLEPRN